MPESEHPKNGPGGSAHKSKCQQISFRNSPLVFYGSSFVDAEDEKGDEGCNAEPDDHMVAQIRKNNGRPEPDRCTARKVVPFVQLIIFGNALDNIQEADHCFWEKLI
ncbi:hypothetical protein ASE55_05935 [Chryseobacterium sp. Leaf201]|nr:hypothetical protein [Chryseobacterium sp. Leaf201]KQM20510.1 hypothetical protein ASE55_05935 [Chryseobacterium sp. Leaf201]